MSKLRVLEFFAGYGSQSMSLRDMGVDHEVLGISEIEPDAIIAYGSIRYNIDELHTDTTHDEMRKELMDKNVGWDFQKQKSKIPRMKKSKLEMLYKFDKATNNYGDISIINPNSLPDFDYMTYSFPCTDISVSGKMEGIERGKTRSGLLYECEKVIETKKPKYLLMENVKNLVGKQFRGQFDEWCEYLEGLGYTNYHNGYKCLNAKNFQIAQNRERIFMFSVLGEHDGYIFPQGEKLTKRLKDFLEESIDEKYYLSEEIQNRFKQTKKDDGKANIVGTTAPEFRTIGQRDLVYGKESCAVGTLVATDYKQPKQIIDYTEKIIVEGNTNPSNHNATRVLNPNGISCTVMENHSEGVQIIDTYSNGAIRGRYNEEGKIEQHLELRNDGVVNTVTTVQKNNIIIEKADRLGGCFDDEKGKHQAGSVWNKDGLCPTLDTMQGGYRMPLVTECIKIEKVGNLECEGWHEIETRVHSTEGLAPTVETRNRAKYYDPKIIEDTYSNREERVYDKYSSTLRSERHRLKVDNNFRIRKLTPRECLRLMGVSDEDISKMQSVGLSDSSLYKLAGNSIVKQVLDALHTNMFLKPNIQTPSK